VWALCEFSLLVSQQGHSDLSLKVIDNALNQLYQKMGIFWEQKMSKSAKARLDDLFPQESHQLHIQKIQKIRAAMGAHVYGAEKISTTKRKEF